MHDDADARLGLGAVETSGDAAQHVGAHRIAARLARDRQPEDLAALLGAQVGIRENRGSCALAGIRSGQLKTASWRRNERKPAASQAGSAASDPNVPPTAARKRLKKRPT
jgi:hypothetical protein